MVDETDTPAQGTVGARASAVPLAPNPVTESMHGKNLTYGESSRSRAEQKVLPSHQCPQPISEGKRSRRKESKQPSTRQKS